MELPVNLCLSFDVSDPYIRGSWITFCFHANMPFLILTIGI